MERQLIGKKPTFHREKPRHTSYRLLIWMFMILGALWFLRSVEAGEIKPLLAPTATPTRMANSFIQEAEAYFAAGRLDDPFTENDAIDTYRLALEKNPDNAEAWTELARIQAYSSNMLSTTEQVRTRLEEALESANRAVEIDPENARPLAVRAFVLSSLAWYVPEEEKDKMLVEAEGDAVRAIQLDNNDVLALAFYAEISLDQQKWSEAEQYAEQAVARDPTSMDAHRVYATVLETLAAYNMAIEEYQKAVEITPNLTFLYVRIGVIYRHLALQSNTKALQEMNFARALENFEKATQINAQLGVRDPWPYIAIAKTYTQMGEFFAAARNAEKALSLNPTEANTYGQLGIIYFKSRNYEYSLPALRCAVVSCTAQENLVLQRLAEEFPEYEVEPVAVVGLPLDSQEVAYYYAEYAQVLAYLSTSRQNFCDQAYPIIRQVQDKYGGDEVLMSIVNGSEAYCRSLQDQTTP